LWVPPEGPTRGSHPRVHQRVPAEGPTQGSPQGSLLRVPLEGATQGSCPRVLQASAGAQRRCPKTTHAYPKPPPLGIPAPGPPWVLSTHPQPQGEASGRLAAPKANAALGCGPPGQPRRSGGLIRRLRATLPQPGHAASLLPVCSGERWSWRRGSGVAPPDGWLMCSDGSAAPETVDPGPRRYLCRRERGEPGAAPRGCAGGHGGCWAPVGGGIASASRQRLPNSVGMLAGAQK